MERININCVVSDGAIVPEYKTLGAAGADVYAFLKEPVIIAVGKSCIIPTGVFYEIPAFLGIDFPPIYNCFEVRISTISTFKVSLVVFLVISNSATFIILKLDQ